MVKCFIVMTDEELDLKTKKCKNENTVKAEKKADKAFTNLLIVMGVDHTELDYWNYTEPQLDNFLAKFWFGVRKNSTDDDSPEQADPDMKQQLYKANSLRNFRYGLNRILKSKGHLYDITDKRTTSFQKSQQEFNDAIKELKAEGKGDCTSYPEILEQDRVKMYNHSYMDPDISPKSLQRKVQFDIRFYFARRGMEKMEKMKKDTFKLQFDTKSENWFVIKNIDELTKNHKDIDELISGFMPENKDDPLCPVCSFRKYVEHLHLENDFLWQTALQKINPNNPDVWYTWQHIGKNTLGYFMQDVSIKCELTKIYTNHSIHVTGATFLTRMNYSASKIMSITGRKSVQSLTRYQKTQDKTKIEMGNIMHQSLTCYEDEIIAPKRKAVQQATNSVLCRTQLAMLTSHHYTQQVHQPHSQWL